MAFDTKYHRKGKPYKGQYVKAYQDGGAVKGTGEVPRALYNAQQYHEDGVEGWRARDYNAQLADSTYAGRRIIGRQQDYNEQMTDKGHNRYYARSGRGPVKR